MFIRSFKRVLCLIACTSNLLLADSTIGALEIMQRADEVRNPSDAYFLEVQITHKDEYSQTFYVAILGNDQTRVETIAPPKERGRNMLMLGQNMWVFLPSLGRETRVGLNQKLMGEAANGDLSRLRWSGDYTATIVQENDTEWELLLQANKTGLTYDRLSLWVEKGSYHPLRAHYLTKAGRLLKRVNYSEFQMIEGQMRPTLIVIEDAIRHEERSTLKILYMKVCSFPPSIFHKSELGRMLLERP